MIMMIIIASITVIVKHSHRHYNPTNHSMPYAQYVPYQIIIPCRIVYAGHVIQFNHGQQVTVVVSAC